MSLNVPHLRHAAHNFTAWLWLTGDAAGFFTFLLVIVAVSQLGLFLRQLRYIRESLDDAKVAAVAAKDASEAAKIQADKGQNRRHAEKAKGRR